MTTRALVLGGGGPVGIAWESGLIAAMAENGLDVTIADKVIGTSAGSSVGAQLALGRPPESLYKAALAPIEGSRAERHARPGGAQPNLMPLMQIMQKAASGASPEDLRRELGQLSLTTETMSEEDFIAGFGATLAAGEAWPAKGYTATAVDTETGEFVTWTAASGVDVARAVASSCSVPGIFPPITINGRRYMDGGMRSATNADLAAGHDRVIVVSVTGNNLPPGPYADRLRARFDAELQTIRDGGGEVEVIRFGEAAQAIAGMNLMDFSKREPVARAGYEQGTAEAARLRDWWHA